MKEFEELKTASTSEVLAVIAVLLNDIGEKLGAMTAPQRDENGYIPIEVVEEETQSETVIPAPEENKEFRGHTRDDIRSAVRKLTAAGRSAEGKQCVKANGYSAIKDIKDEDIEEIYSKLMTLLQEAE